MQNNIYDIIGVGIGPFNLGLAALSNDVKQLNCLFVDKAENFNWHPGLMFNDATLQVPFMADLVTMANPCSKFSFLNYLKENDRLYKFYIREDFFVLRKEYNKYCQWVIDQLDFCHFGKEVMSIAFDETTQLYQVLIKDIKTNECESYLTRKLALGIGVKPHVPPFVRALSKNNVCHAADYLNHKEDFLQKDSITVVGSGQSAAEVFYDLLQNEQEHNQLNWLTRPDRFFPMEYSKLTLELTSPEYVDHFHSLSQKSRDAILKKQNPLYKGINYDLINAIHEALYQKSVETETLNTKLYPCAELVDAETLESGKLKLHFYHTQQERRFSVETDTLILATGYKYSIPAFTDGIKNRIQWDEQSRYLVNRNYSVDKSGNEIFVQNAELHTHGFVTPDLGMGAYRNATIINEVLGYEFYKIEKRIAFQSFTVPAEVEELANA